MGKPNIGLADGVFLQNLQVLQLFETLLISSIKFWLFHHGLYQLFL